VSFECAVVIEGEHCRDPDAGDAVYLRFLTFCATHQAAFEDVVLGGLLQRDIVDARYRRSYLFSALEEARRNQPAVHPAPVYRDMRHEATVYFLRCEGFIKIGYSAAPHMRLRQIQSMDGTKYPVGINCASATLIQTEPGGLARERELHAKFKHLRHTGEWFTETPELSQYIESLSEATP
jgi:hypothetical protein